GLMALLGVTALAIPVFFARRRQWGWGYTLGPLLGGLIILAATTVAFGNYSMLTGVDSAIINQLPYVLVFVAVLGVSQALWLRAHKGGQYAHIGSTRVED